MENTSSDKLFRNFSIFIVMIGIIGSLGLMFHTGRHNKSIILILLFTVWVASPFLGLLVICFSKRLRDSRRRYLYFLMIFIAVISLIIYSGAFGLHGPHPAFVFMVVPLISWLVIGTITLGAIKKKIT
jgi:uncharacterized membrane protein YhaH (DUF805 family)